MNETSGSDAAQSSGNMLADRRYDYAMAARAGGDHAAAADLLEQTLELSPHWSAGWFALGDSLEAAGERHKAETAYAHALALSSEDSLGSALRIARLRGDAPVNAPQAYVRALFDQYAPTFDAHLVEALDYCAPELLRNAIAETCARLGRTFRFSHAVDLGCGTGLAATALRENVSSFSGVDLSPAMVRQAQLTGLYCTLAAADLVGFMKMQGDASADIVLAADVFVYMGDLEGVFGETARVLQKGGLFGFSLQATMAEGYVLGDDLRFAHSRGYLDRLAAKFGFKVENVQDASYRKDRDIAVPGLIVVLEKP